MTSVMGFDSSVEDVHEVAKTLAETLTKIRQLNHDVASAKEDFRQKALVAVGRLNAFLMNLGIQDRYTDWCPFFSEYYGVGNKWRTGYRLVLDESMIKVEEFDEWRSYMYGSENPVLSFDKIPVERFVDALERLPEFLKLIVEELEKVREKYQLLTKIAEAIEAIVSKETERQV